jgi:hypothetical protein
MGWSAQFNKKTSPHDDKKMLLWHQSGRACSLRRGFFKLFKKI